MVSELTAFGHVNFDWVVRSECVWDELRYDIEEIHSEERARLCRKMDVLVASDHSRTPLGCLVLGPGGSGKTHLLRFLRQEAAARNMTFLFADMTGVRNFWETMRLQIIESLDHETQGGHRACRRVLAEILDRCSRKPTRDPLRIAQLMAELPPDRIVKFTERLIQSLAKRYRFDARRFQDVIRALVLFNSDDPDQSNVGWAWFLGTEIGEEPARHFRFAATEPPPIEIVRGLSWLLSVRGPTLLAIDQVDNIVAQYTHLKEMRDTVDEAPAAADQRRRVMAITEEMAGGFSDLIQNVMQRTLVVLSCHQKTWDYMLDSALKSSTDRFDRSMTLSPMRSDDAARRLIEQRLADAYAEGRFTPPYRSWPFRPSVFEGAGGLSPREILKKCNEHREACLCRGRVLELGSFGEAAEVGFAAPVEKDEFSAMDDEFEILKSISPPLRYMDPHEEDIWWPRLLQSAIQCLVHENPPSDEIDAVIDSEFAGKRKNPGLHGRLRLVDHARQGLESHYCFRTIFHPNAVAFQSRLKAAMTASGIDRRILFRQLVIVRNTPIPSGARTKALVKEHERTGGLIVSISDEDLSTILAVENLETVHPPKFEEWLRARRPLSSTRFMADARMLDLGTDRQEEPVKERVKERVEEPVGGYAASTVASIASETRRFTQEKTPSGGSRESLFDAHRDGLPPGRDEEDSRLASPMPPSPEHDERVESDRPPEGTPVSEETLTVGRREVGGKPGEAISVPWTDLARHVLILGGTGSGKTVLIKRIVEEAALAGIPSIVVDKQYDLSHLGDVPPSDARPSSWTDDDRAKAEVYASGTDVVVWTPGVEGGNPLNLSPLPDFAAVEDDLDQLEMAVQLAADSLHDAVNAGGGSDKHIKKRAVLAASMRHFAQNGGGLLDDYIALLRDPPSAAVADLAGCEKIAAELSDLLVARKQRNPLWRSIAEPVEPETLFGLGEERTRVSVLNLFGLGSESSKQEFLNQIVMRLYTWIKKHPAPEGSLRGLLVIDEARDFVPSRGSSACKETLCRMTAQARKFGLGLIFATQAPKDIDHRIVNNCFTQFYGQFNSPAAIAAVRDLLVQKRAANPDDIARLRHGRFYFFNSNVTDRAFKILTPMCLSYHATLDEAGVMERAKGSRQGARV